eukprot:Em0010g422a
MKRPKAGTVRQAGISPNTLIAHLQKIASPAAFLHEPSPPLASVNNLSILEELKCAICANVLSQPLELMCSALVCTMCLTESIAASGAVSCPCCSNDGPLLPIHVRPASNAILLLLSDVRRHCAGCNRDIRSGDYEGHECVPSLTPEEEKQAAELLKRAISTSPDKGVVQLATGGAVGRCFDCQATDHICLLKNHENENDVLKCREYEVLSVEGKHLPSSKKKFSPSVTKSDNVCWLLQASHHPLRLVQLRWLKSSGIHLAGEERMRHISSHIVGNNLKGEVAPFTFPLPSVGDEIKGAPLVYIPHLVDKVLHFLNENESVTNFHVALDRFKEQIEHMHGMKWRQYTVKVFICGDYEFLSKMYGLSGASGHATERSLEGMSADHQCYISSGSIKKDAQKFFNCISVPIFDIPIVQVCPPGLHIMLGIFTKLFHMLEAVCSQLDLELALQRLPLLQVDLENAKHAQEVLQQVATYVALVNGEKKPLAVDLLKQSTEKKKSVKALEAKVAKCIAAVERGYPEKEGPFVKILDNALQSFGVQRQQYFSGAFIGNHVHKALQNYIDEAQAHALDQAIEEFFYRNTYPEATVPLKMHLLEDHAVQWANTNHVGFGLLGEQGAESIHANFNRLGLVFAPIRDRVENLLCIVNPFTGNRAILRRRCCTKATLFI